MPFRVEGFRSTPNPNAIVCLVQPSPGDAIRSYAARPDPDDDPLAAALFDIPGVTRVMIQPTFITVNKAPATPWPPLRAAIERTLADAR